MLNNFPVSKLGHSGRRSSSFSLSGTSVSTEVVERPIETTGKAKLKYVQMEIAEKEACKLLKTLCQDAAKHLHKRDAHYDDNFDIQDLLTGILLLGNMSKRMAVAMDTMEEVTNQVKDSYFHMKAEKDTFIAQLEAVILKLRDDKILSDSSIIEMNLKHEQRIVQLNKEIIALKEAAGEGHTEVHLLRLKIATLERKVMEIPRMEERYLRTARGIVRQQEAANTVKEVEFKKIEEDVKSLQYWKNKSANLEEILIKQNNEVENYSIQARSALAKYQTLLNVYNTEKRQNKIYGNNNNNSNRPGSAPAMKRSTTMKINDVTITSKNEFIVAAETAAESVRSSPHRNKSLKGSKTASFFVPVAVEGGATTTTTSNNNATTKTKVEKGPDGELVPYRTLEQIQAIEINKLKRLLSEKEERLNLISRKLAKARAYPLFNVDDEEAVEEGQVSSPVKQQPESFHTSSSSGINNKEKFGSYNNNPVPYDPKGSGKANIKAFFHQIDLDADNDSIGSDFARQENLQQNNRFARAIAIEQEYQNRILKTRANNPPHIAAIRQSQSFAKMED